MVKSEQELEEAVTHLRELEKQLQERERIVNEREREVTEREAEVALRLQKESEEDEHAGDGLKHYWRRGVFVKSLVFGGLDGLTTTIALICSAVAVGEAEVSIRGTFFLGCATLFADAFSMGLGDYLSSIAEGDVRSTTDKKEVNDTHAIALRNGVVMFCSFVLFGGTPLISFLPIMKGVIKVRFQISCFLAMLCLFTLGCVKGRLEGVAMCRAGILMMFTGGVASVLSYGVSTLIHHVAVA